MQTFDHESSAEAFTALSTLAEKGQVIYLTHHRHLLDIVRDAMGKDRGHDLVLSQRFKNSAPCSIERQLPLNLDESRSIFSNRSVRCLQKS